MFCQKCGQQISSDTRFCPNCGYQNSPGTTSVGPAPVQNNPQQGSYQQQMPQSFTGKKKRTGCLVAVVSVAVLAVILVLALIIGGGSCSITTAKLVDVTMAASVDEDTLEPVVATSTFPTDAPIIYAVALLKNAPDKTLLSTKWFYVTENIDITTIDFLSTETNQYVNFSISRPDNGFPPGEYEVEFYIDGELSTTIEFSVEE